MPGRIRSRFIDSMLLVDEADNIMKYNFDVLRQILLQGREFGVGVLLASQYLSHFRTSETDYAEPLLTWFVHKVPNVTARELESIGLSKVAASTVEKVKALDVHECLYKTLDVPGRFMRTLPSIRFCRGAGYGIRDASQPSPCREYHGAPGTGRDPADRNDHSTGLPRGSRRVR